MLDGSWKVRRHKLRLVIKRKGGESEIISGELLHCSKDKAGQVDQRRMPTEVVLSLCRSSGTVRS